MSFGLHFLAEHDSHRKVIEVMMKRHLEKGDFGGEETHKSYEALLMKGLEKSNESEEFEEWRSDPEVRRAYIGGEGREGETEQ